MSTVSMRNSLVPVVHKRRVSLHVSQKVLSILPLSMIVLACPRLRDNWESANTRTGGNWREEGRHHSLLFADHTLIFSRAFHFRVISTIWEPGRGYTSPEGHFNIKMLPLSRCSRCCWRRRQRRFFKFSEFILTCFECQMQVKILRDLPQVPKEKETFVVVCLRPS